MTKKTPPISDAQHAFLRAVRDYGEPDSGWAEVELQFINSAMGAKFPVQLEASLCVRVTNALERRGLLVKNPEGRSGPELTEAGRRFLKANP